MCVFLEDGAVFCGVRFLLVRFMDLGAILRFSVRAAVSDEKSYFVLEFEIDFPQSFINS